LLKEDATIILISNRYAGAVYKAKNLVNIFDNYFDAVEEEVENIATTAIPEVFSEEKKKGKGKK